MKSKELRRFKVVDEGGHGYVIHEFASLIENTNTDSTTREWREGMHWFQLPNGEKVNRISDTEFDIVSTGIHVFVR